MADNITMANSPLKLFVPSLGTDVLIITSAAVREGLSQPFNMQIEAFAKNSQEIAFDKVLGQKATIEITLPQQGKSRFFSGIVTRFSQGGRDVDFTQYRLEVTPSLSLLIRRWQSRIFQHINVPDILRKVLKDVNPKFDLKGTYEQRDFCVQYRESDFNFANRLMEEEGIYYFFEHTKDGHQLVIADTPQSHPSVPVESTAIFDEVAGGSREDMRVYSWGKQQELRSGKHTLWDHSFELPHKHLEADKTIADSIQVGTVTHKLKIAGNDKLEIYDFPGEYAQRFDGVDKGGGDQADRLQKIFVDNKRTVGLRMEEDAAAGLLIQGAGNCRQFTSGHKFKLDRHFNGNGEYVLTSITHAVRQQNFVSGRQDFSYSNSFTCIPIAQPFRPQRTSLKPVIQGTQTAVVVGQPGDEIFTDKYGRIKVQFHWDREGKNDANSSCWLRVASAWAGKQWGAIHIPRVGQEVVVAFQEGDPDQPIVVGSVYNAEQMPPYKLPEHKTQSGTKSRSTLKGTPENFNEFRFEDKKGEEQVYLHAEKNFDAVIENNETRKIGFQKHGAGDQNINIANNQQIIVGALADDGGKPADGSQLFYVWNNQEMAIGNGEGECADGSQLVSIWNNQEVQIGKGEGQCNDGSQIVSIYKNRTYVIKTGDDTLQISGGSRKTTIDKGDDTLKLKMGNKSTKLDLGKITYEAMQEIVFKVGQNSIKIDQTGITISGMLVKVEGQLQTQITGLMTQIKADAMLMANGAITMIN